MSTSAERTVRDIMGDYACLEALDTMLKRRRSELRAELEAAADRSTKQTGAAANFPIKGLGRVYVTQPESRVVPTDEAAWRRFVLEHHPKRALQRRVLDVRAARLEEAVKADPDLERALRTLDAIAWREEIIYDGTLLDDITADLAVSPAGELVDRDSGELMPLKLQAKTRATLVVKIERAAKEALVAEMREQGIPERALRPMLEAGQEEGIQA